MTSSTLLWADAVTFEATVNSSRISTDEALQLTLTFTGVNDNLDPINLPVLDGFSAKYLGPSTSVSIVNGVYHSEKSFVYNLFPNKIGKFQIPEITATVQGQTFTTKPISVEVYSPQIQGSNPTPDQNPVPNAENFKDKVMIVVSVDKTQVYLNERIPVSIKLLVNDIPVRDIQFPQFDKTGFLVDEFDKPQQSSGVFNGVRYDTVEFKTNIYPNQLGEVVLGPVQIQGNMVYKTNQENPFGQQDNSFFGASVFNNFFDSYTTRPMTVKAEPIKLQVSSLPQENRPQDFSGAIGQFEFQANVSPARVKVGDPLTLKMDIRGNGNFKSLKIPVFQSSGFKAYDPQIKGNSEGKTAEEVIIPTSVDIKEVPAIRFSYFDTASKDYKTITQGPFPIQVIAPNPDQDFKAVGFADVSREPSVQAPNTFSLGKRFIRFLGYLDKLSKSFWFWISFLVVSLLGISFFLWNQFNDRLENDPAFARRLKAVKEAKRALAQAERFISSSNTKELYGLISRVLREYLANKWHYSSAALSIDEISNRLKKFQLDEKLLSQVKELLETSDFVCFAGASRDKEQMLADLSLTKELIPLLEKSINHNKKIQI